MVAAVTGFPREADAARTAVPRRPAATSVAGPRRRRSTGSSPRTSRAGLSGGKLPSGPCRAMSRRSFAAISSAGSSASASPAPGARAAAQGFVVAFSCKGRGVCPSCNGRHMAQTAAHLADHVIPPVPVRQWVISVPKRLRGILADRPRAVAAVTKIFLDEIERTLSRPAAGVTAAADTPVRPPEARRHLLPAPLRLGAQPPRASPRLRDRRRLHAACRRSRV